MKKRGKKVNSKKKSKKKPYDIFHLHKQEHHPIFHQELSLGQKAADAIAKFGGSWAFIMIFFTL